MTPLEKELQELLAGGSAGIPLKKKDEKILNEIIIDIGVALDRLSQLGMSEAEIHLLVACTLTIHGRGFRGKLA